MNESAVRHLYRLTALCTAAAVIFSFFFQINKGGPFRTINPFGEDPYDAVGSFAFQAALLVGVLSFARALRLRLDPPAQAAKGGLILRGNGLVLGAMAVTLAADGIAVIRNPVAPVGWGAVLLAELAAMILLAAVCSILVGNFWSRWKTDPPPQDLTPADAIDDLLTLVRVPAEKAGNFLPRGFSDWIGRMNSDRIFSKGSGIDPRKHPWRFACLTGLLAGILLMIAQWREGLPPSLAIGLLVTGIFVGGEFSGVLIGFAVAGGFLGLRPVFHPRKDRV
jgi:hypothetical protein